MPSLAPALAASTLPLAPLARGSHGLSAIEVRRGLARVNSCGARYVDLTDTWLPVSSMSADDTRLLQDELARAGLTPCGVSLVRHSILDPETGAQNLEHTRRAISLAKTLGAGVVSLGFHEPLPPIALTVPFWSVEAPLGERADPVALIRQLADEAVGHGVALSLELYEGGPLGSGRQAIEMVNRVGRPNVGINLDVGNLYRSPLSAGESWQECVRLCLPRTNYWHAKNYRRIHEHPTGRIVGSIPTSLQDGDIDYRHCLDAARACNYRGPIVVEQYGGDGISAQRSGVAYLQDLLGGWSS